MKIIRQEIAEEMVPTPDIQGGSSDVFGDPSTNSVSSWNAIDRSISDLLMNNRSRANVIL